MSNSHWSKCRKSASFWVLKEKNRVARTLLTLATYTYSLLHTSNARRINNAMLYVTLFFAIQLAAIFECIWKCLGNGRGSIRESKALQEQKERTDIFESCKRLYLSTCKIQECFTFQHTSQPQLAHRGHLFRMLSTSDPVEKDPHPYIIYKMKISFLICTHK